MIEYFCKKKNVQNILAIVLIATFSFSSFFSNSQIAYAAINEQINYQGKLTTGSGVAVPDGTYNMEFKLYTVSSAGTAVWTETRTGGNRVQVTSGLFSVMLGSVSSLSGVDFNQSLYLGVNIGGSTVTPAWDGEMSPRKILGAVPAAFEAKRLNGLSSGQFLRSDAENDVTVSTTNPFLKIVQNGAGKIFELIGNGAVAALTVLSNGRIGMGTSTPAARLHVEAGDAAETGLIISGAASQTANLSEWRDSAGNPVVVIDAAGKFGIGTSSPSGALEIGSGQLLLPGGSSSAPSLSFSGDTGTGIFKSGSGNTGSLIMIVNGSYRYQVGGAENVTYGNLRPSTDDTRALGTSSYRWNSISVGTGSSNFDGKMGVGVAASTAQLTVKGSSTYVLDLDSASAATNTSLRFLNDGDSKWEVWTSATDNSFNITTSGLARRLTITSSGDVGIGTSSPAFKLDVNGTGRFSGDVTMDNGKWLKFTDKRGTFPTDQGGFMWDLNNDQARIFASQPATDQIDFVFKIADNTQATDRFIYWIDSYTGEADDAYPLYMDGTKFVVNYPNFFGTGATTTSQNLDFYLMGQGQSSISNAYFFGDASTGNVGIGTTNPQSVLHVNGNIELPDGAYDIGLRPDGTNFRRIIGTTVSSASSFNVVLGQSSALVDDMIFMNESGVPLIIKSNGYVGIGTTTPAARLDVYSTNVANPLSVDSQTYNNVANFRSSDDLAILTIQDDDTSAYINAKDGYMSLGGVASLGNNNLNINIANGYIGIGTTTPTTPLYVRGSASGVIAKFDAAASSAYIDLITTTSSSGQSGLRFIGATSNKWFIGPDYTSGSLFFNTGATANTGTVPLVITNTGNIGIGTSTPATALNVVAAANAGLRLAASNSPSSYRVDLNAAYADVDTLSLKMSGQNILTASRFPVKTSLYTFNLSGTSDERLTINSSGYVGIGTTTPESLLDVVGAATFGKPDAISAQLVVKGGASGTDLVQLQRTVGASLTYGWNLSGGALTFVDRTAGVNALQLIIAGGTPNVIAGDDRGTGMGLNAGTGIFRSGNGSPGSTDTTGGNLIIASGKGTGAGALSNISFQTPDLLASGTTLQSLSSKMVILGNGNVGIGTTSPFAKFSVAGDIIATGSFRDSSGSPGTNGMVLKTTGTGSQWVATSTLGFASAGQASQWVTTGSNIYYSGGNVGVGASNSRGSALLIDRAETGFNITNGSNDAWNNKSQLMIKSGADFSGGNAMGFFVDSTANAGTGYIQTGLSDTTMASLVADSKLVFQPFGGNVGVGTSSPFAKLSVDGDFFATGSLLDSTGSAGSLGMILQTTGTGSQWVATSTLGISGGGSSQWITTGSDIYYTTGNVGIGTNAPQYELEIHNASQSDMAITTNTNVGSFNVTQLSFVSDIDGTPDYASIGQANTSGLRLSGIGNLVNPDMMIAGSGNIGIGTTSPWKKLSIAGDISLTGGLFDSNSSSGTSGMVLQSTGTGTTWVATSTLGISGGDPVIAWGDFTGTLSDQTDLQTALDARLTLADWYATTTDGITEGTANLFSQWSENGSSINYSAGNVGIGTTSPARKLSVSDDGTYSAYFSGRVGIGIESPAYTLSANGNIEVRSAAPGFITTETDASNQTWQMIGAGGEWRLRDLTAGSYPIRVSSGIADTVLTIDSDGDVGIGTTTPTYKLDISAGDVAIANGYYYRVRRADNIAVPVLGFDSGTSNLVIKTGGSSSATSFNIRNTSNADMFTVLNDGKVGIGTTAPGDMFVVKGGTAGVADLASFQNANGNDIFKFYQDSSNDGAMDMLTDAATVAVRIQTSGDSYFNGGNLGIGTTAPSKPLSVLASGTVSAGNTATVGLFQRSANATDNAGINIIAGNTGTSLVYFGDTDSSSAGSIGYSHGTDNFYFNSASGSGYVGIGTTTPSQQLTLTKSLMLEGTTSIDTGVIYKGATPFMHNFQHPTGSTVAPSGENIFIGLNSGNFTMGSTSTASLNASYNTGLGSNTLSSITTGYKNVAIGGDSLRYNTTGYINAAVGYEAMLNNTTGLANVALGAEALKANTSGGGNSAIGYLSLTANTTANYNSALGNQTLKANTTGYSNTAIGYQSAMKNTTGYQNSTLGDHSLFNNTTGYNNSSVGYSSLYGNTTGFGNLGLGYRAGENITSGNQNIIIGYDIDVPVATGSNQLNIGNLIFATGVDGTGATLSTGNVGIGTTTPGYKLDLESGDFGIDKGYRIKWDGTTLENSLRFTNSVTPNFNIMTNGVDRLLVDSDGDVSIGGTIANRNNFTRALTIETTDAGGLAGLEINSNRAALATGSDIRFMNASTNVTSISTLIGSATDTGDLLLKTRAVADTVPQIRMIIDENGLVGIGNNIPSAKLTLSADASTSSGMTVGQFHITGTTNTSQRLVLGYDTTNDIGWLQAGIAGTGYMPLVLNPNGANVGIGTTDPETTSTGTALLGTMLNVKSPTTAARIAIDGPASTIEMIESDAALNQKWLQQIWSGDALNFRALNDSGSLRSSILTLSGSGNVGIGTTTPTNLLTLWSDSGVVTPSIRIGSSDVGVGADQISGEIEFYGSDASTNGTGVIGFIRSVSENTTGAAHSLAFGSGNATNLSERMRINSIGNVGIGTTTPTGILDIYNPTSGNNLKYTNAGTSYTGALLVLESANTSRANGMLLTNAAQTASAAWFAGSPYASTGFGIGNSSVYDQSVSTGAYILANMKLFISTAGDIGIGHTAPGAKLDIDTGSNVTGLRLRGTAETTEIADLYVGSSGQLVLSTDSNTDSAPFIEIDPNDDEYGLILRESGAGTSGYANFYLNEAGTTDYLNINVGATNATAGLILQAGGKVGIGTTSPQEELDIYGDLRFGKASGQTALILSRDTAGTAAYRNLAVYGNDITFNSATTAEGSSSGERLIIKNGSGNVGIATTSPWRKLSVTGTVGFDGLSAAAAGGSALCLSASKEVQVNTGTATCTVSSARFKDNINYDGTSGLDALMSLKPATFTYLDSDEVRVGFIAEDVSLVDERLIFTEEDGETPRGVRYEDMVAVVVKAVQQLNIKFDSFAESIAERFESKEIYTNKLCIGSTCISEPDLKRILDATATSGSTTTTTSPSPSTTTSSTASTSTTTPATSEGTATDATSETTPEIVVEESPVTPEPTPETVAEEPTTAESPVSDTTTATEPASASSDTSVDTSSDTSSPVTSSPSSTTSL